MKGIERILDANQNRCVEGIRVLEDYCRFILEDGDMASRLRTIRHFLRKNMSDRWMVHRNSQTDVGRLVSNSNHLDHKTSMSMLIRANTSRVCESLRVIEEYLKVYGNNVLSKRVEEKRFEFYSIEKALLSDYFVKGLYAITAEGSKADVLQQVEMFIEHKVEWIQYRDKNRPFEEVRDIAKEIVELAKGTESKIIINDYVDIAIEVGAFGVHVGQGDLSIEEVRKRSKTLLVGVSTHNRQQFMAENEKKPDYIAIGPIFGTKTKMNPEACEGLGLAEFARAHTNKAIVAIGGIDSGNIHQLKAIGIDSYAMVSSISKPQQLIKMKALIGE